MCSSTDFGSDKLVQDFRIESWQPQYGNFNSNVVGSLCASGPGPGPLIDC